MKPGPIRECNYGNIALVISTLTLIMLMYTLLYNTIQISHLMMLVQCEGTAVT